MERFRAYATIGGVILAGILLQLLLILADSKDTPGKAAEKFAEAYYRLDPAMRDLLCEKTAKMSGGEVVESHIRRVRREAAERGFGPDYMKQILYNVETHTVRRDDVSAEVSITGRRRTSVNPVYALAAKFFQIGETRKVHERLTVIKEDGRWKVCGNPFSMVPTDTAGNAG